MTEKETDILKKYVGTTIVYSAPQDMTVGEGRQLIEKLEHAIDLARTHSCEHVNVNEARSYCRDCRSSSANGNDWFPQEVVR